MTSTVSGAIGMAGGVLLLSAMTFFITIEAIVPIHGVTQLVSNSSRFFILRKYLRKKLILSFALGLPFGIVPSKYLVESIQSKHYFYLAISLIILLSVFKPKKIRFDIPEKSFFFIGVVVGFLGLFVGATGPFIAPFFLNNDYKKEEVVANKACIQTLGHLIKIPAFISLGFDYSQYLDLIILMIIAAIIGTKLGVFMLGKINETFFSKVFKGALIFAAFRLLFNFFHAI